MTVYLDSVFALNFAVNWLLLRAAARLGAAAVRPRRIAAAAALGAAYAVAVYLPGCGVLAGWAGKLAVTAALLAVAFGLRRETLRLAAVFGGVTLALCGVAWGLLAAADANFAALGQQVSDWWSRLLNNVRFIDRLMYILLSLPVGAWLYGLVGGSLRRKAPPATAQQCAAVLENCRIVPRTTAVAAVMALCGVYALFFAVQAGEWLAAAPLGLDAPDTAAFAVNGFWELLKILLLNFAVLAGIQFFGRAPLPKALAAVFCGFGVAFAALAAGKLAVYVTLCALTPRRFTAAWCLFVLAVCAVLALVRVFKPIPAAKLAIFAAAVSFTLLCCVNVKQRVIDVNLARYEAGIDEELDWGVLWECGYQENATR